MKYILYERLLAVSFAYLDSTLYSISYVSDIYSMIPNSFNSLIIFKPDILGNVSTESATIAS